MFQSHKITATKISAADTDPSISTARAKGGADKMVAVTARDSTKDAGRVHIGGGMMRFHSTKDAGCVHIGGGMMRF